MAIKDTIKRHLTIIKLLRKSSFSLKQILDYLIEETNLTGFDLQISERTFKRDREDIEEIWGIKIKHNRRENVYEITNDDDDLLTDRLIESLDMVSVLNRSRNVSKYIYLENRKSNGIMYFNDILYAIENQFVLEFTLNSYWSASSNRKCVPKAIKETHNRYYLIAWDLDKKEFRNFGLDRISNFKLTYQSAASPSIDIDQFYKHAFGIECYNDPEKVILKFQKSQQAYLESLPLHTSQTIINLNDGFIQVELFVHPTNELVMEIMKYGAICEVIQPQTLRNQVKEKVSEFYSIYF
ncbi:helix-turn-helix transcriptional regulator [Flavobacterium sp. I3-2]|uniref:helix-turn-helix transcriptional regulator n=1 Tax=Flavobacterium sp. I3-2 TaxID=2748319 RepID=UPI0015A8B04F|nr:WYL domain-containing protein [Flavobacterium sp. I3-2]